jgi:hypothetical protein
MARNLHQQEPGRESRHAFAACSPDVAEAPPRNQRARLYRVTPESGDAFTLEATGREAWALDRLIAAGPRGCTPIHRPAPRWSAYVHTLRERGVPIETVTEKHGGDFPGWHGRYVLRAAVTKGGAA